MPRRGAIRQRSHDDIPHRFALSGVFRMAMRGGGTVICAITNEG